VTLGPRFRGDERNTGAVSNSSEHALACGSQCKSLAHRAAHIDPQQLALIGGGAAHVRNRFGLLGGRIAGAVEHGVLDRGARQDRFGALEADR
jgi:hypothetical protein